MSNILFYLKSLYSPYTILWNVVFKKIYNNILHLHQTCKSKIYIMTLWFFPHMHLHKIMKRFSGVKITLVTQHFVA